MSASLKAIQATVSEDGGVPLAEHVIGEDQVHFISREDLIAVKLASGRDPDLKDADSIKRNS